ncbi:MULTISPECIES: EAL and HDOD domain-containing protein [Thalassolituus]|jgi:EAL and modified HD-GYP domain-containing signal transduction protein|uniref:EAL and HDOD domain-containing protein n=1 Tax=Thalassolituus TaxID=187492 RepID=UPI00264760F5|nr:MULTISPECIES: HDOD domain-containing protein [Thalassolituus]|tara:strand:+ start:16741 stop:17958 length:1218 start_codon:yes stop_codon:yes gene_type:complete
MQDRPLLARQPILDSNKAIYAYELLCRPIPDASEAWQDAHGNSATTEVVIGALHEIGMALVTGGRPAFVNFTADFLSIDLPLSPDEMVIELLEHIPATDKNINAVTRLKQQGFRIAVDDFTGDEAQATWLKYADIVKVDLPALGSPDNAGAVRKKFHREGLLWLAEKVETHEEFEHCKAAGYDLFQGYFFSKPVILFGRRTPDSHLAVMQLLGALNQEEADFDDIVDTVRRDPQLSYRLLQMANSPQVNHGAPITTLQRAATALGLSRIRNWANLLALGKLSDKPAVLQQQALFRGYLMQSLSAGTDTMEPDTAFTLGLFSLLDAMLDMPIDEVCARVNLPKELTQAITENAGVYGQHLKALMQWEKGAADTIDWASLEVTPSELEASIEQAILTVSQQSGDLGL